MEKPDGTFFCLGAEILPEGSKSGDCFTLDEGRFVLQKSESEKRRNLISSLLEKIVAKK